MSVVNGVQHIKLLGNGVQSIIRSGVVITSVIQCIEELVLNAIDANASHISISVDLFDFKVKVEDDGTGISKEDLEMIGTRYATCKCHTISDLVSLKHYGYRGEALASIIDVSSFVEIYSQSESDPDVYYRKFKEGVSSSHVRKVTTRKRASRGVTVSIEGFLSRLPVRQKQITSLEIEYIKKMLERIYIMNSQVQIHFRHKGLRILQTASMNSVTEGFHCLYKKTLTEVSASYGLFGFQAWFSNEFHPSKSLQFVYVNKRYTSRNNLHRNLAEILEDILGVHTEMQEQQILPGRREKTYPIFVLNILTSVTEYDIIVEPSKASLEFKNWEAVLEGLSTLKVIIQAAIRSAKRSDLLIPGMKKANSKGEVESDAIPLYGKSISTRVFRSAIHSNVVARLSSENGPRDGSVTSVTAPDNTSSEAMNGTNRSQKTQMDFQGHGSDTGSKMSKFKSPGKPKIPRHAAKLPQQRSQSSNDGHVPAYKKERPKRRADEPLFLHDYSKRIRTTSLPASHLSNGGRPSVKDRIQELFPVFRDKKGVNALSLPKPSSIENLVPPSDYESIEFHPMDEDDDGLDSPFRRMRLSQGISGPGGEIQSEGILDIPFRKLRFQNVHSPVTLRPDHFYRVVDDHLERMRKALNLPDLAEQAAGVLRRIMQEQDEIHRISTADSDSMSVVSEITAETHSGFEPCNKVQKPKSSVPVADIVRKFRQERKDSKNLVTLQNVNWEGGLNLGLNLSHDRVGSYVPQHLQYDQMENQITTLDAHRTTLSECRFVKEDLKRMRVIGQVDDKFIVAKCLINGNDALVLFDQHAVHERIRLEKLIEECRVQGNCSARDDVPIKSVSICPPVKLQLTDTEIRVIGSYTKKFENNGLRLEVPRVGNVVLVHTAPACFVERMASEPKRARNDKIVNLIHTSIQNQVRYILETNGLTQQIPQETFELLCTQACHGAIKFGDHLDRQTCQQLITELANCKSPFQCAHGRPVLTPIFDLNSVPGTEDYYQAEIPCITL